MIGCYYSMIRYKAALKEDFSVKLAGNVLLITKFWSCKAYQYTQTSIYLILEFFKCDERMPAYTYTRYTQ